MSPYNTNAMAYAKLSDEQKRKAAELVVRGIPKPLADAMVRKVFRGPYG